jgi:protein-L-isoaspartate(D-aspartate) O-methyltransferase
MIDERGFRTSFPISILLFVLGISSCAGQEEEEQRTGGSGTPSYRKEARDMLEEQIIERGIEDERVIEAFRKVPRHRFVPPEHRDRSYADHPLPIGEGQTISQPYVVAHMTELLELEGDEKVLEIGTGSGYQAAILGELAREVQSLEIRESLAEDARKTLKELGYGNVHVHHADGYEGWPEEAPYDRIIVTAAPDEFPEALKEQLKVGGRAVVPVGSGVQQLKVYEKEAGGSLEERSVSSVQFVPMIRDSSERE